MAQAIGKFIDRIQLGSDEANQIAIGSSAYAVCDTSANTAAKVASIPGFYLNEGTTIHIKFIYNNSASDPTLNVSSTGAIPIVQYGTTAVGNIDETSGWQAGAVIAFTLVKNSNNWYWTKNQGYNTDTHYTASLISGGSNSEVNTAVTSGNNIYLRLFDGGTNRSNLQIAEGNNMTISSDANGVITFTATDTTYSNFVQSGSSAAAGLVPAPDSTAGSDLFLCENGTWATPNYTTSLALSAITGTDNLQAIEALQGTGLLEKTISGWTLDTNTYLTSQNTACIFATTNNGISNITVDTTDPYLTVVDGSDASRIQLEGAGYTTITANSGVITISTNVTASDLGLSNAMHFMGQATQTITSGGSQHPTDANAASYDGEDGDVYIDSNGLREYVWSDSAWILLGLTTSNTYDSNSISASTADTPTWISRIQQSTDGTITVERQTIGVLPVSHGGTGTSTAPTENGIIYAASSSTYASTLAGGAGKVLIGNGSSNAPGWYEGLTLTSTTSNNTTTYSAAFSNNVTIGGALEVTGAATLSDTLSVDDATTLGSTLTVNGNTTIGASGTASTLDVWGATTLKSTLNVIDATTLDSTLEVTSTSKLSGNVGIGDNPDNAISGDTHILSIKGNTRILNSASTIVAHFDTNTTSGSLITIYPHTTNTGTLGTTSYRWKGLYVGSADSYGDPYTPIYWDDGKPATVSPQQHLDFEFNTTNTSSLTYTSTNYSAIGSDTEVSEIVITEGMSYLNSEVTWAVTTESNVHTLTLSATTNIPSNAVIEGYVILSHTANITSNT